MASTLAAFYETRDLFRCYVDYSNPLSFEEWVKVPDEKKVAVLYLQFFNEILNAWSKANTLEFVEGEEGVTTALQYLQKLVCDCYIKGHPKKKVSFQYYQLHREECDSRRILETNPRNFYGGYIYRVLYNALYCICHDIKSVQDRMIYETDPIVGSSDSDDEVFDIIENSSRIEDSVEETYDSINFQEEFWSIIEDSGMSAEKVMRYLLSGRKEDLLNLSERSKNYASDPLRDVSVKESSVDSILGHLRKRFLNLPHDSFCGEYISTFQSILSGA